jgi:(p)ppGpp synthase/HD superfamily hydrolase
VAHSILLPLRWPQVPFSYELRNGDVVSILTGEGKPATDWMRYAKSRSTRSKLRSYFRAKQKESLREAGKILLMDYLRIHGSLLEENTYLPEKFTVPTTLEDMWHFLPGRTRYEDLDDMLIDIGRKHDRSFLHNTVAKLFLVPQSVLVEAEENRKITSLPQSVAEAVQESRKVAKDAAKAAASSSLENSPQTSVKSESYYEESLSKTLEQSMEKTFGGESGDYEYADPEHLCEDCLPIYGDAIVGTRSANDEVTTVHRLGCPHAQFAINHSTAQHADFANGAKKSALERINSVALRIMKKSNRFSVTEPTTPGEVVNLRWSHLTEVETDEGNIPFLAEVAIVAQDRKLLLADCSEIVSEMSEIVRTGSSSSREHATLVFLVKVSSLEHLQKVMDALGTVRSVMSVERRVSF